MAILDDNEFTEVEGRYYVNPQVGLDESNAFIDNLRSTQQANNQQIQTDTYNLGTEVPSNLGGLTSPSGDAGLSYFTSRYQTPQTNAAVANLRAVAQANALNQALQNEQEIWKKRYNDAYRRYQKSVYDKTNSGGGGGSREGEETDFNSTDTILGSVDPLYSPAGSGTYMFTPSNLGDESSLNNGGALNTNNVNTLTPAGKVNIVRNSGGGIESLTYNGKTYTGDAAKSRFDFLTENGSLSKVEE